MPDSYNEVVMQKMKQGSATLKNRESVLKIMKKYGAKNPRLFGSYARSEQTKHSDVDFVVDMPKDSSLIDLVGMKLELEKKLGRKVDVVTYKGIKPLLRSAILQEAEAL